MIFEASLITGPKDCYSDPTHKCLISRNYVCGNCASVSGFYNIYTAAITYTTRYNTTYYTRLKHHKLIHGTAML